MKYFSKLIPLPLNISYPVCFSFEDICMGGHWSLLRCINNAVHESFRKTLHRNMSLKGYKKNQTTNPPKNPKQTKKTPTKFGF